MTQSVSVSKLFHCKKLRNIINLICTGLKVNFPSSIRLFSENKYKGIKIILLNVFLSN